MANITLQEMYDEWKKAANGIGTPSDSAQPDPTQAATIIAALKGQLERLGDLLEQMQGNGTGAMPVQLTGSNVPNAQPIPQKRITKIQIDTLMNAVSINPGEGSTVTIGGDGTESEIWALISIDQQPWSLRTGVGWFTGGNIYEGVFPKRSNVTSTTTTINPAVSLLLGAIVPYPTTGLTAPMTLQEAKQFLTGYNPNIVLRLENLSASVATATLKVVRVWR